MQKLTGVYQDKKDLEEFGEEHAPWHARWTSPSGSSVSQGFGPGVEGRRLAIRARQRGNQRRKLAKSTQVPHITWKDFIEKYKTIGMAHMETEIAVSDQCASFRNFERICNPWRVVDITTEVLDTYTALRSKEPGRVKHTRLANSTLNKELNYIMTALRTARKWAYVSVMPRPRFRTVLERLPTFVSTEEMALFYDHCHAADSPTMNEWMGSRTFYNPESYWQALSVIMFMTGWRSVEIFRLLWENVDLDKGTIFSPAEHQKGRRDELIPIHPVVVEHLTRIKHPRPQVFEMWKKNGKGRMGGASQIAKARYKQLHQIQDAAGLRRFGFHDFRRGFATENAQNLTPSEMQKLMKHRSFKTTMKYMQMGERLEEPVKKLTVPESFTRKQNGQ